MEDLEIEKRKRLLLMDVLTTSADNCHRDESYTNKRPCRDLSFKGAIYVKKLLQGHPNRFREVFRMEVPIFNKLCDIIRREHLLQETANTDIDEQLAMFLFTVGNNASNHQVQELFQHSGKTIDRYFSSVLDALRKLSYRYVRLPSSSTPPEILNQSQFFPFFKDCIGAIDGIHIPVTIDVDKQKPFRNRKGFLSQNVMVVCSFDLRFLYIRAGWEGSASDSRVLQAALENDFQVPEGKYYLVDGMYANRMGFIAPYRGLRYHLKEFGGGLLAPQNAKELFNYRHSSLRNAVELTFGVLKKRFPILTVAPSYPFESQVKLAIALCTLHNYIRVKTSGDDWLYEQYERGIEAQPSQQEDYLGTRPSVNDFRMQRQETATDQRDIKAQSSQQEDYLGTRPSRSGSKMQQQQAAADLRDKIANDMWEDYCSHRCE